MCYNTASVVFICIFDPEANGILVPWPGIKAPLPALEVQSLFSLNFLFYFGV